MSLKSRSVLVVEDEMVLAMMLQDYLVDAGARVVGPAMTVKRAMELIESEDVDVALLDVNLRGERSEQVGLVLKAKRIPYVYATGYGTADEARHSDAPTVRKPYRLKEIEAALVDALGSRE
jgi:DNA-binding NtrC family response regulator